MMLKLRLIFFMLALTAVGTMLGCIPPVEIVEDGKMEVQVKADKIVIMIQTLHPPESYSGIDMVWIVDNVFSERLLHLYTYQLEYHVNGNMFVVTIDKPLITQEFNGFNMLGVMLNGRGKIWEYRYHSENFVWLVETDEGIDFRGADGDDAAYGSPPGQSIITRPTLSMEWETRVLDFKVQVSKTILFLTPYIGIGVSHGWPRVSYGLTSSRPINLLPGA